MIDDSSTAGAIAGFLRDIRPLTVITNNLGVIADLSGAPGINLIALGGHYSKKFNGFSVSLPRRRCVRCAPTWPSCRVRPSRARSAFHQGSEVVQIKRQMVKSASRKYLLVDHGKFGRSARIS
ncbi:hypothetical protein F2981_17985 [Sinorhizobium meliloti]|nr:hypothetical protein [Sinorhizobium meliloti]